jgi:polar amino acid transport system substrate-binding protein
MAVFKKLNMDAGFLRRYPGIFLLALALVFAPASAKPAHAGELVLAAADSAPTAFMENGKPAGMLVDIVTEALRRAGYPVRIKLMPWARCLAEARAGTVDGVFSSFRLPEREVFLAFTDVPVMTQVEAFFVRSDSGILFDGDLAKLKDVKIGVIRDTSYGAKIDGMIRDGTWKHVRKTNHVDSLVAMLVAQRFDLAPSYRHVVLSAAKKAGVAGRIKELGPSVDAIPTYLAFNKINDYTKVIAAFNKAMEEMKKDKTLDSITGRYLE